MSLRGFLWDLVVKRLLGHQLLQPNVLLLKRLQLLGHLRRHPTMLLPRAVVRLFGDLQNLADLGDLLAVAKSNVCLAELLNNLIGRVSCLLQLQRILSGLCPDAILS